MGQEPGDANGDDAHSQCRQDRAAYSLLVAGVLITSEPEPPDERHEHAALEEVVFGHKEHDGIYAPEPVGKLVEKHEYADIERVHEGTFGSYETYKALCCVPCTIVLKVKSSG